MAKKNEKDLKIEALEAKVKNLEEAREAKKKWNSIPEKWRIVIVVGIACCLLCSALYLYLEIKAVTDISTIEESEFQRISMVIDSAKWKVSKGDFSLFRDMFGKTLTGIGYTYSQDGIIKVELCSTSYGLYGNFYYDSGYIKGIFDGLPAKLFFSESVLKTGRTLTLYVRDKKIVFYESE